MSLIYNSIIRIESVTGIFCMPLSTLCSDHSINSSQNLFSIKQISPIFLFHMVKTAAFKVAFVHEIFRKYRCVSYFDADNLSTKQFVSVVTTKQY